MRQTLVSSILVAVAFFALPSINSGNGDEVCKTDDCKNTAERILKYMDPEIKPCDDFYQFTCGKLLKYELPKGKVSVSSITEVQDIVNTQIRELLEEPIKPKEHSAYKATKRFYALCLDEKKNSRNVTKASNLLHWVGWPVLGEWREDQWTLHDHEIKLKNLALGGGGLFHIDLRPDPQNPGNAQITVDQPTLTRQFIQNRERQDEFVDMLKLRHVQTYRDYMVNLAVMFGADRQTAEHQLRDSLLFELGLEKIVDMPRGRHRPYELMTVAELQGRAGWVDWPALLVAAGVPKSLNLDTNELLKVYEPDYLDRLRQLIEQYPKRAIANFMGWRAAERLSLMLTPEMVARKRQFDQNVGLEDKLPWEICVELVSRSGLGIAVSSMYVNKHMPASKQTVAIEMTSTLRDQMYSLIKAQDWMEDNTKTRALLKLCKMKQYIGYPNELINTKDIDEYYQNLNLYQSKDFIEAQILISKWMNDYGTMRLHKFRWAAHGKMVSAVNAFYDPQANMLQLTAAILHPPFFSPSLPKYIYYPAIGAIAGHEITHGFDNLGVYFDADGNFKNWWDDLSKMNFIKKGECIMKQYSEYIDKCNTTEAGGPIPYLAGNDSLGEIIADSGGLKLAYLAYKKLSEQMAKPEPILPNLEQFTRDQMFFISLGSLYCTLNDRKEQKSLYPRDMHPPAEFRVNGVLQNYPKFSEAFGCKAGTNMNPKNKCSVW